MFDLDQYFTPDPVADYVASLAGVDNAGCCVDTACGEGSLLRAAERLFGDVVCVGIDKDRSVIRRLRRRHPGWVLSVTDIFSSYRSARALALHSRPACDLLLLNPPFSMARKKSVPVTFAGEELLSSVAMAHILSSLKLFEPSFGAVAIVPESMMYSETDKLARQALRASYEVEVTAELSNSTFKGTRANALVVRFSSSRRSLKGSVSRTAIAEQLPATNRPFLVRGGLPVFQLAESIDGYPLVHTTDLARLVETSDLDGLRRVRPIGRGTVSSAAILVPRVGCPIPEQTRAVNLAEPIQLSDCVVALTFTSFRKAHAYEEFLHQRWPAFLRLYHGTGARYVTIQRLREFVQGSLSG